MASIRAVPLRSGNQQILSMAFQLFVYQRWSKIKDVEIWIWVKTYDAIFGWLFTSINPIYFDVHERCQGFDPLPYIPKFMVQLCPLLLSLKSEKLEASPSGRSGRRCSRDGDDHMTGWWLTNPSENYESQLGWWHSQLDGKIKAMFQSPPTRWFLHQLEVGNISSTAWKSLIQFEGHLQGGVPVS